jgi:hypothetical protein
VLIDDRLNQDFGSIGNLCFVIMSDELSNKRAAADVLSATAGLSRQLKRPYAGDKSSTAGCPSFSNGDDMSNL